jgi:TPR repeat protein
MRFFRSTSAAAALVAILMLGPAVARAETFYQGLRAFNTGDYDAAARIWGELARANDANAQSGLGLLYYKGLGVETDLREALKWFGFAANQGVVQSQLFLGIMHYYGFGVPKNNVWAYMWTDLAVSAGYDQALDLRDQAAQEMTEAELTEARRRVAEWLTTHFPIERPVD